MLERSTFKWFVRGFGLTLLVGLAAFAVGRPAPGWAQGGQGNLASGVPTGGATAAPTGATDDPLGRTVIPLAEDAEPVSNLEAGRLETGLVEPVSAEEGARAEGESLQAQSSPLVIPAADFRDDGLIPNSQYFSFSGGYHEGTGAGYGCMMAPAYVPSGVQLTELFASVYDNSVDLDISLHLWRVSNFDGAVDLMAAATTAVYEPGEEFRVINDLSIDFPNTLYPDYSYYVTTCLPSAALRLYSVRLYFNAQ